MRPHGKVDRYFHQCTSGNTNDDGRSERCEKKELEPQQLFVDLGLLICEAREPEFSERGRVQGPHCPLIFIGGTDQDSVAGAAGKSNVEAQKNKHLCDDGNVNCARARQIETELRQLWSRGIPACLTVSLLPEECLKQDTCVMEALVLEKWTIQQVEKRTRDERSLPAQFLMQAVRSHLHFSQLSAWLTATRGKSPGNIIYRICLPGESETSHTVEITDPSDRPESLEKHRFPLCSAGKNFCVSVTVESTPRCDKPCYSPCSCLRPSTSGVAITTAVTKANAEAQSAATAATAGAKSPLPKSPSYTSRQIQQSSQETVEERDVAVSGSFCNDRSRTPTGEGTKRDHTASGQPVAGYVPLSLPHSICSSSTSVWRDQKHTCVTNPLFQVSTATSGGFGGKYRTKSRLDVLRNEASILRDELRALASTSTSIASSTTSCTTPNVPNVSEQFSPIHAGDDGGKALFFVPNDEDDNDDNDDDGDSYFHWSKSHTDERYKRQFVDCKSTKRILVSDEGMRKDQAQWINEATSVAEKMAMAVGIGNVDDMEHVGTIRASDQSDADSSLPPTCLPSKSHGRKARRTLGFGGSDAGVLFHPKTGLPLSSSPAPLKRNHSSFNYDPCINSVSALKSALYCYDHESGGSSDSDSGWPLCKSAPASTNLLGSFEESALNGRIKPYGTVDGFTLELGASGAFCPTHVTLPVTTLFYNVSDDNAPSPYFGLCSLESIGRRGYHVPRKGSVQATLFNPQETVVKMFVVRYDLSDMPPSCQTFVRQRTFFMPSSSTLRDAMQNRSWLRYLIHLRFASSSSGKLFLHTDIRMLFSRKSELDAYNLKCVDGNGNNSGSTDGAGSGVGQSVDTYELRSFTDAPKEPKFSPRKFNRSDKGRNAYR